MTKFIKSSLSTLLLTLLTSTLCLPLSAHAHGDTTHAKPASSVNTEQKPWGIAGDAKAEKTNRRTVTVTMQDTMRFSPDKINVKQGETINIVIKNAGAMLHEFVIGTPKELEEHAALMVKFPTMEHDEPYMAHVPAGKTGRIVWTFNQAGEFDFACLIAGHFTAGMRGKIIVSAK